ncbi:hypothetical protein PCASD_00080 [Puccinia coronata f. sp. avenae]|uniref:Uncharacterized protein n=1 Tax=Puccinia coronata f. sp. avenae TaxID=200324 RepID=A0A2N5VR27_9BASI|nr:hypothetical protein PCASD_00080 [Puccinia coronata f. sp. avenae]
MKDADGARCAARDRPGRRNRQPLDQRGWRRSAECKQQSSAYKSLRSSGRPTVSSEGHQRAAEASGGRNGLETTDQGSAWTTGCSAGETVNRSGPQNAVTTHRLVHQDAPDLVAHRHRESQTTLSPPTAPIVVLADSRYAPVRNRLSRPTLSYQSAFSPSAPPS